MSISHSRKQSWVLHSFVVAFFVVAALLPVTVTAQESGVKDWPTIGQLLSSLVDHESERVEDPAQAERDLRLISVDPLPNCTEPKVRLEEVFDHSEESDRFDMLFYNPYQPEQLQRANEWPGNVTGYEPKLYLETEERRPDFWQDFARLVKLSCLPTRFRFTYVGSRRYREFREGARAWDE